MIAMADRTAITIWLIVAIIILGAIALICSSVATDAEKVKGFEQQILVWKTRYEEGERVRSEERDHLYRERAEARRDISAKEWSQWRERDLGEMP